MRRQHAVPAQLQQGSGGSQRSRLRSAMGAMQVLGYDLLLDAAARPWLVEVNHSPSFQTEAALDVAVKGDMISDALRLVRPEPAAARRFRKVRRCQPACAAHASPTFNSRLLPNNTSCFLGVVPMGCSHDRSA